MEETERHLFRDCRWAKKFWFISLFTFKTEATIDSVWWGRNKLLFKGEESTPKQVVERAKLSFAEFSTLSIANRDTSQNTPLGNNSSNVWKPHPQVSSKLIPMPHAIMKVEEGLV
ncbi:hypothetical protein PIB30_096599 [Stylosanthes scabra]|uniref:Uncharacterized protein n=1 Tax=Stylosanthes scabra TaxID=79078 RepID=A0ABU6QWQ1_9FABA|nr:hypothetical protein [Stylosanthes scabra]